MKKVLRNIVCGLAAVNLIALAASCSDGLDDDDPFVKNGVVTTSGGNNASGNSDTPADNGGTATSGSFDMPENQYDKGNTQYKGPTGIASLAVGDKVKMTFKGKASKTFKGEFFIVDTTEAANYWLEIADKYEMAEVPVDFTIEHTFEITKAPKGTGSESTYFAVVGKDDATTIHIDYTELKFEKLGGSSSSGDAGNQQNNGTGENQQTTGGETTTVTPVTYSTARKAYTVSLTKAVDASVLGYVLQIDNDGTKDADGLKIDISNLKLSVKVGDADAVEKTFGEFNLVPNQWANPAYGKTDARKNLGLTGNLAQGTEITVQVLSGTVSNSAKAPSIIFALQEDAAPYGMLGTESGDSQDIWLPAFAEATEVNAEGTGGAAANQDATNVIYDGKNVTLSIPQNFYEGANHGISLRKTVAEMGINLPTPQNGDSYTIYMKGTADHYEALGNMCVGFETDYDWQDCAMDGSFDLSESKLTAGTSKDVTFNGTADGDWYFWFYDGDTDANAEPVTLTLSEFKITKK